MPNVLKRDPTRTVMLRRRFSRDMKRRFRQLSLDIKKHLIDDKALDGTAKLFNDAFQSRGITNASYTFPTNAGKVKAFREWLKGQVDQGILLVEHGLEDTPWLSEYVDSAYRQGTVRAYTDVHASDLLNDETAFYLGGKAEFLRSAFAQPETTQKIELLYTRAFSELEGVTAAMDQQISRILAEGLAHGRGMAKIVREMRSKISEFSKTRAEAITRTEIIRAHAEGQLDSFEALGVMQVHAAVEWLTAGDDRVCDRCASMEGSTFTIEQARGILPLHPNCRCAWIPGKAIFKSVA
jgi:SPP1 gp7 family putative phage head morphogenesis protein